MKRQQEIFENAVKNNKLMNNINNEITKSNIKLNNFITIFWNATKSWKIFNKKRRKKKYDSFAYNGWEIYIFLEKKWWV